METFNLNFAIKFVKGWEESTTSTSQTGDFSLFLGLLFLGIIVVSFCSLTYLKNKKYSSASHIKAKPSNFSISSFSLTQKLALVIASVIACLCIGFGVFGAIAHADNNESPLTPDKTEIQAVVEQDGTITLDTCTLTNTTVDKLQIQSSAIAIANDAKEVKSLENCKINIVSDEGTAIYSGNPNGVPQSIYDLILDPNDRFTLNFKIDYLDTDTAIALCGKNVFTLSFQTSKFFNIVTETDGHGTLTCDLFEGATAGTEVTLIPVPSTDYELDAYETIPQLTIADNKFTMPASNVSIKAKFKLITHTITLQTDGHGTLTCDHSEGATAGTEVTLIPAPSTDYVLDAYETTPQLTIADNKFTMPASNVSIKAKFKTAWIPMQAEIHNGTKIDFYPAFSNISQIAGYKFATYYGKNYHEIKNITSMSSIYSALQPSSGTPTTTLYYQKTSSNAQYLKCYTVKNLSWNYVFGTTIRSGIATAYDQGFINDYQKDKSGNDNGIKTALLNSDGFGSNWDNNSGSWIPMLANNVTYDDDGFYGCYGGWEGGLLSRSSDYPWGCYASDSAGAYFFFVSTGSWEYNTRETWSGVVLARAFN